MKKIEKEKLLFKEMWDKPSRKGYPTKESIVITIAINTCKSDTDIDTAGFAIKLPGDQHIPKIGRSIARRAKYSNLFDIDINCPERDIVNYFQLIDKHYPSKIMNRIKAIIKRTEIGTKMSEYEYPKQKNYTNYIED